MRKCLIAVIATLVGLSGLLGPVAPANAQSKGEVVIGLGFEGVRYGCG